MPKSIFQGKTKQLIILLIVFSPLLMSTFLQWHQLYLKGCELNPDSHQYIAFSTTRAALYPLFIRIVYLFNESPEAICFSQILTWLLLSIVALRIFSKYFPPSLLFIISLLFAVNPAIWQYGRHVYTEALMIGFYNLFIAQLFTICFVKEAKEKSRLLEIFFYAGICVAQASLKPNLWALILPFFFISILQKNLNFKRTSALLSGLLAFSLLLKTASLPFDKEKGFSLMSVLAFSKASFSLSQDLKNEYPEDLQLKNRMTPIFEYLSKMPFATEIKFICGYEDYIQFGNNWFTEIYNIPKGTEKYYDEMMKKSITLISHHPIGYLKVVLKDYIGLWLPYAHLPYISSGEMDRRIKDNSPPYYNEFFPFIERFLQIRHNYGLSIALEYFYVINFFIIIFHSAICLYFRIINALNVFLMSLGLSVNLAFFTTAIITVNTPRYSLTCFGLISIFDLLLLVAVLKSSSIIKTQPL
ncbi:MAG: hypothetical protein HQK54_01940 [Oligoflexales bacterium]|nr:hypothetical protein [Oligoflexales bacterium]